MRYFTDVKDESQLRTKYRTLVMENHPDKGGSKTKIQTIIDEYNSIKDEFLKTPITLYNVKTGNQIYVNTTKAIVTRVDDKYFKAKSTVTGREAIFSKKTGKCLSDSKYKAVVWGLN